MLITYQKRNEFYMSANIGGIVECCKDLIYFNVEDKVIYDYLSQFDRVEVNTLSKYLDKNYKGKGELIIMLVKRTEGIVTSYLMTSNGGFEPSEKTIKEKRELEVNAIPFRYELEGVEEDMILEFYKQYKGLAMDEKIPLDTIMKNTFKNILTDSEYIDFFGIREGKYRGIPRSTNSILSKRILIKKEGNK